MALSMIVCLPLCARSQPHHAEQAVSIIPGVLSFGHWARAEWLRSTVRALGALGGSGCPKDMRGHARCLARPSGSPCPSHPPGGGGGGYVRGDVVTDDQFHALMHDVRKIVYSLAVIIGLLIAILGLYAAHLAGALPAAVTSGAEDVVPH
jgi:hypothetical protein